MPKIIDGNLQIGSATNVSDDNLIAEISGLRNELDQAKQQASDAFNAGYQSTHTQTNTKQGQKTSSLGHLNDRYAVAFRGLK